MMCSSGKICKNCRLNQQEVWIVVHRNSSHIWILIYLWSCIVPNPMQIWSRTSLSKHWVYFRYTPNPLVATKPPLLWRDSQIPQRNHAKGLNFLGVHERGDALLPMCILSGSIWPICLYMSILFYISISNIIYTSTPLCIFVLHIILYHILRIPGVYDFNIISVL